MGSDRADEREHSEPWINCSGGPDGNRHG